MSMPSAQDIARVKGMGFLHNRGTDTFSGRLLNKNGTLSAEQLMAAAEMARTYGNGRVTFTSRLQIEIPGIHLEDIDAVQQKAMEAGMTFGGTGARVRPITACKGTTCVYGNADTQQIAAQLYDTFYTGWHDVTLPHKFKIGVGGCPNSCMKPSLNDFGVEGVRGFSFDPEFCRGCKKCAVALTCPNQAVSMVGDKAVIDGEKCSKCGLCVGKCKMDIRRVGDQECIQCGECIEVCPTNAIQWKGPKILLPPQAIGGEIATKNGEADPADTLQKAKKKTLIARCVAWGLALAVLGGALYYFNFVHKDAPKPDAGFEVGDACNAMDLAVYNGTDGQESFNVQDQLGKVTVINFWGTWCGPCIAELPHFDQVATDYVGRVMVVAVHSDYKGETAADWIAENYPETSILFAQDVGDGGNGAYYTALGGEGDFPMTIIVNKDGVITFTCRGSITHDELVAAVEDALAQ